MVLVSVDFQPDSPCCEGTGLGRGERWVRWGDVTFQAEQTLRTVYNCKDILIDRYHLVTLHGNTSSLKNYMRSSHQVFWCAQMKVAKLQMFPPSAEMEMLSFTQSRHVPPN